MNMDNKDHFEKLYWFCIWIIIVMVCILIGLIWIPPNDKTIANVSFGFVTGVITMCVSYLIGGNPSPTKKPDNPGTTTADISATVTTVTDPQPQ